MFAITEEDIVGKWKVCVRKINAETHESSHDGVLNIFEDGIGYLKTDLFILSLKWNKYLSNNAVIICHGMGSVEEVSGEGSICAKSDKINGFILFKDQGKYELEGELIKK